MNNNILPKWAKEILRFLSVKSQFLLWGNVYDVYQIEYEGSITTLKIFDHIKQLLSDFDYNLILNYEPLIGFTLISSNQELIQNVRKDLLNIRIY